MKPKTRRKNSMEGLYEDIDRGFKHAFSKRSFIPHVSSMLLPMQHDIDSLCGDDRDEVVSKRIHDYFENQ